MMVGIRQVGFTGARVGLTLIQGQTLAKYMQDLDSLRQTMQLDHGDCIGADTFAHVEAKRLGWEVYIHPPMDPKYRAFNTGATHVYDPEHYGLRNVQILEATQMLIACPNQAEHMHSGTWMTVRYARRMGRPRAIIWPNGEVTNDNP